MYYARRYVFVTKGKNYTLLKKLEAHPLLVPPAKFLLPVSIHECCRGCGEFYEVFNDFGYEGHISGKFFWSVETLSLYAWFSS